MPESEEIASPVVPAHKQKFTHSYAVVYPEHEPRENDPHKHDFLEYKRRRKADGSYHCDFAVEYRDGDQGECDLSKPLECHHKVVELALKNGIDFALLEEHFPGISRDEIGEWIDTDPNLELLCVKHHRGHAGKHVASFSDFTAMEVVRNMIE